MKKSIGLLSALVVSTTFIVNCQKAPDKRRVRPSSGPGTGAQTDVVGEKAKLPTKVCSKEIIDAYTKLYSNQTQLGKMTISADSTDADKEAKRKLGVETLAKCEEVETLLKGEENEGCYRDNGVKDISNAYTASGVHGACKSLAKKLESEVGLESALANEAKADDKAKVGAKEVEEKFIGKEKTFNISEQALNMMYEGNTNLGQFLVDGEVKSSQSTLETSLAASKTVCTAISDGIDKDVTLSETVLRFTSFVEADKATLMDLALNFKGKATTVNFVLHSATEVTTVGALVCLNLDHKKLTVSKLEEVFGKAITVAPTKVTTEVTGGTSEAAVVSTPAASSASSTTSATTHASDKLAAAQPEGSPQQKLLDEAVAPTVDKANKEAEQKAAQEKKAKEAAAKAEQEAQKPAVTLVPATGVSSPAAAAKVEAEGKVNKEELASMKEKAERLEKEAKDAEAEVTKLETEKAKAEDIDQAKAKARIARESANSAKAEYETAAKA